MGIIANRESDLPLADEQLRRLDGPGQEIALHRADLVRAVAMVFDRRLQTDRDRARFSRII